MTCSYKCANSLGWLESTLQNSFFFEQLISFISARAITSINGILEETILAYITILRWIKSIDRWYSIQWLIVNAFRHPVLTKMMLDWLRLLHGQRCYKFLILYCVWRGNMLLGIYLWFVIRRWSYSKSWIIIYL